MWLIRTQGGLTDLIFLLLSTWSALNLTVGPKKKNREIKLYCLAWCVETGLHQLNLISHHFNSEVRLLEKRTWGKVEKTGSDFFFNWFETSSNVLYETKTKMSWEFNLVRSDVGSLFPRINVLVKIPRFYLMIIITFQTIWQKFCLTFLEPTLTISGNVSSASHWSSQFS